MRIGLCSERTQSLRKKWALENCGGKKWIISSLYTCVSLWWSSARRCSKFNYNFNSIPRVTTRLQRLTRLQLPRMKCKSATRSILEPHDSVRVRDLPSLSYCGRNILFSSFSRSGMGGFNRAKLQACETELRLVTYTHPWGTKRLYCFFGWMFCPR